MSKKRKYSEKSVRRIEAIYYFWGVQDGGHGYLPDGCNAYTFADAYMVCVKRWEAGEIRTLGVPSVREFYEQWRRAVLREAARKPIF
jgi:hypothetical protein